MKNLNVILGVVFGLIVGAGAVYVGMGTPTEQPADETAGFTTQSVRGGASTTSQGEGETFCETSCAKYCTNSGGIHSCSNPNGPCECNGTNLKSGAIKDPVQVQAPVDRSE